MSKPASKKSPKKKPPAKKREVVPLDPHTFGLMVRIPRSLHDKVVAQAAYEDRSQRAFVVRALQNELARLLSIGESVAT